MDNNISYFVFCVSCHFLFNGWNCNVNLCPKHLSCPYYCFHYFFFTVLLFATGYNMNHSYIEITHETIRIIEYPFFKKRERIVLLSDIKQAKWQAGGRGRLSYLVFKNDRNKNLFHLDYVPEVISYFEGLGVEIQH